MLRKLGIIILALGLFLKVAQSHAQVEPVAVVRSQVIETIDGRAFYLHTVQPGQTLFGIARAYGVSIQQITQENKQFPDLLNVIRIGMVLRIPATGINPIISEPVQITSFIEHKVARRETLFGISRRYQITQEEIMEHNPDTRRGLRLNQILRIPVHKSVMVEFFIYSLKSGETFSGVANHFGIPQEELARINPGLEIQNLSAGQTIRIPARAASIAPPMPPAAEAVPHWQFPRGVTRQDAYCLNPELKPQYNVALLIPLYLDLFDETVAQFDPNHVPFTFIQFYQGVLVAIDSIRQQGVNITLHTFDVGSSLESAMEVTRQPGFERMDLIIGPFFPETILHVAEFGRRNNISVVSPFYDNTEFLKGHPNLFQVSTSLPTQLRAMASYLARTFYGQNIVMVHNNLPESIGYIQDFRNNLQSELLAFQHLNSNPDFGAYKEYLYQHGILGLDNSGSMLPQGPHSPAMNGTRGAPQGSHLSIKEVIYRTGGIDSVRNNLDLNRQNVLVTLINGEAFLAAYLRELNQFTDAFQITLFGTSEWIDYHTINLRLFERVRMHAFSNDFTEYRDQHIRDFVYRFRNTFQTEPDEGALLGVQTAYFFLNALVKYGRNFARCVESLNAPGFQHPFYFQRAANENDGWENVETVLFRQQGFRRTNVLRPDLLAIP